MNTKKILTAISLLLIITSCNAQDFTQDIVNSLGEPVYKNFNCKVSSKTLVDNSLFILCNTKMGNQYSNAIVITTSKLIQFSDFSENDDFAVIIPNSKKYIVIYNKTKSEMTIVGVIDGNYEMAKANFKSNVKLTSVRVNQEFYGFGLSFLNGSWDVSKIKQSPYKYWHNILDYSNASSINLSGNLPPLGAETNVASGGSKCTSGGVGSSSCSTEGTLNGCSVTCMAGYYACCDDNRMKCYCVVIGTPQ